MTARKNLTTLILLLGVLGTVNCIEFDRASRNCTKLRNKFSNDTKRFFDCAIANSEPVTYCQKCGSGTFAAVVLAYKDLTGNETCKAKYFNQDRLNILEMVYSSAVSLWEAGKCSNCYDWVDGEIKQNLSQPTIEFLQDLKSFHQCTNVKPDASICSKCQADYNKVNDDYTKIKESSNDHFCFDIRDAMNKTRLHWSHDLNCCKDRKTSLTAFIVSSVVISVLIPFLFYTSFMFFACRREQFSEPLIDSDFPPSVSEPVVTAHESTRAVPAITNLLDLDLHSDLTA